MNKISAPLQRSACWLLAFLLLFCLLSGGVGCLKANAAGDALFEAKDAVLLPKGLYVMLDRAEDTMPESNNYSIAFDLNNAKAGLSVILYNVADGSDCTRLYIDKAGNPMIQVAYSGYSEWYGLYLGAGQEAGVYVNSGVAIPKNGTVRVEMIHYDGWLIFKVDGQVYMACQLSSLNEKVTEGAVSKIGLECETEGAVTVSNVEVREYNASANAESFAQINGEYKLGEDGTVLCSSNKSLELSAKVIGSNLTGKWYVNDAIREGDTQTLSGEAGKTYRVYYKVGEAVSNAVNVTFYAKSATLHADADYLPMDGSVNFTLETEEIAEDVLCTWMVKKDDGEFAALEATARALTLNYSDYADAGKVTVYCQIDGMDTKAITVLVQRDILDLFDKQENVEETTREEIAVGGAYGNYAVGSDESGNYLFSDHSQTNNDTHYALKGDSIAASLNFSFSFDFFIPDQAHAAMYVPMTGFDKANPLAAPEARMIISQDGKATFDLKCYEEGTNADYYKGQTTYTIGAAGSDSVVKYDTWQTFTFVAYENTFAIYVDGKIVAFGEAENALTSQLSFNMFQNGQVPVQTRVKNIVVRGVAQPAAELESVSLSISAVNVKPGTNVTVMASMYPANAEAQSVQWLVDGQVYDDSTELRRGFVFDKEGTYEISCKINGVESPVKTVKVQTPNAGTDDPQAGGQGWILWVCVGAAAVVAVVVVVIFLKRRK